MENITVELKEVTPPFLGQAKWRAFDTGGSGS